MNLKANAEGEAKAKAKAKAAKAAEGKAKVKAMPGGQARKSLGEAGWANKVQLH